MSESAKRPGRRDPRDAPPRPSTSRQAAGGNGSGLIQVPQDQPGDVKRVKKPRTNQEKYAIVQSRPPDLVSKKGTSGKEIRLQANYFRLLTKPKWTLYQYHVDFEPNFEVVRLRCALLANHKEHFGGFLYDGTKLFSTTRLPRDRTVYQGLSKSGERYTAVLKFVGIVSMNEWQSLQVLNIILRRSMHGLNLQLVGRNLYDPVTKIDLRDHKMELWPGYETSIRQHEQHIMMSVELVHKVMRTETVYDIMNKCRETKRNFRDEFNHCVLGLTVLTDYNNKTYRINSIDFEQTPENKFDIKGKDISYIEYYKKRYNITIHDPKQPLLIAKAKDKSKAYTNENAIILVPELCRATGLTDSMRSDFRLMQAMAKHTRMMPKTRIERLYQFNQRLQNTRESVSVLDEWNMQLERNLVDVVGRQIDAQRIVFNKNNRVPAGERADWTRCFRDKGLYSTPSRGLERWVAIAPQRNARDMKSFINTLIEAGANMQMRISNPHEIIIYDDRNNSYVQAILQASTRDPQIIFCVVPNNNLERYSIIKKKSCLEHAIPSQVITVRTMTNNRGTMSIATKVAIQLNCKLGYTPWMVDNLPEGLMTIGFDIAKSSRDTSKAYSALVSTMDLTSNATFFSTVAECSSHDLMANNLWPMMIKAIRQYRREHNDKLPERILFYRDGVGEGSLKQVYEYEVKEVVENLEDEYKRSNMQLKMAFIVVTKSAHTRLFANGQNPPAGTVVDDIITLPECYDFFLVSQHVNQGTVSPTNYNIIYSNIKFSPDQIQKLTFKMCHLYYNWSGTTRVPAVCQYAKKLATMVATSLYQIPRNVLEKKLYYL